MRSLALVALLCLSVPSQAAPLPDWAAGPVALQTPASMDRSPAVDLLREGIVRFDGSGRVVSVSRRVVRILTKEGRQEALARAIYSNRSGKVRSLRAWIHPASGPVRELDDDDAIDVALVNDDLYNEVRTRALVASDEITPGSVFVSEAIVEGQTPFAQFRHWFQERCPVVLSRFRVESPPDWSARSAFFHHVPVPAPPRTGDGWTWELTNLAAMPEELNAPGPQEAAPGIGVTLARAGNASHGAPRSFATWEEVSAWLAEISEPPSAVTPPLTARAQSLVAGAATEEAKVRAIAKYVQRVNYVAVQMGLDRGGGYRPHEAADVLSKNYGDCKDKANLMRALLRAAGVESYLVVLSASDPDQVREEWPSPWQFDHCIIGVRTGAGTEASSITTPGLGTLALFDPTDSSTPWGTLPEAERGALVLVVAPRQGAVVRTPEDAPSRNRVDRSIEAELLPGGDLRGTFSEISTGGAASEERYTHAQLPASDYARVLARRIGVVSEGEVLVDSVKTEDAPDDGFVVRGSFQIARFARPMGGFLVFRPNVAAPATVLADWTPTRSGPVRLRLRHMKVTVHLHLPQPYVVDELPASVALDAPFAAYRADFTRKEGLVGFERLLELKARSIPAEGYAEARRFFEAVRTAESVQALVRR